MARVCEDWFPKGSYPKQRADGFYMNDNLKTQLDIAIKNVVDDWDFTIIISGGGEVRTGKSMLAMQIAMYWTHQIEKMHGFKVPFTLKDNFVFKWDELIKKGNALSKKSRYCCLDYDEAGETLEGVKAMTKELRHVKDYLRECGQYNFLNIMVLPEFFDLPRPIALTRSTFLINVYYTSNKEGRFVRGYFNFYSRRKKKRLYLKGKKELNYRAAPYNFNGRFYKFYPIDEHEYRQAKFDAIKKREIVKRDKLKTFIGGLGYMLNKEFKMKQRKIREKLQELSGETLARATFSDYIEQISLRNQENSGLSG